MAAGGAPVVIAAMKRLGFTAATKRASKLAPSTGTPAHIIHRYELGRAKKWYATLDGARPQKGTVYIHQGLAKEGRYKFWRERKNCTGAQCGSIVHFIGKLKQRAVLSRFAESHGCQVDDLRIMPRTFDLQNEDACRRLWRSVALSSSTAWLLKPRAISSMGKGIEVVLNSAAALAGMQKRFGACAGGKGYEFVAQEYIQPLLVEGRKFDLRTYLLVASTSPVTIWFARGYVRLSLTPFNATSTERSMHLTNYHQQLFKSGIESARHSDRTVAVKALWPYRKLANVLRDSKMCESDIFRRTKNNRTPTKSQTTLSPCAFE